MVKIKSPHVVELLKIEQNERKICYIYEHCNRDLYYLQSKQKEKVFKLSDATEILASVMNGLEELHKNGYRHMNLKS